MGILSRLRSHPTTGDSDAQKGALLLLKGQYQPAIHYLELALKRPLEKFSRSDVFTMIGNCYNSLNKFEKALEYHSMALQEDPRNYKALVNKGIVYRLMEDYDAARQCYDQAMEIAPDYAELHASLGALLEVQENYAEAVQHLERAVQMNDSMSVGHANLAVAYAGVHRFEEADAELRKAVLYGYRNEKTVRKRIAELRKKAEAASAPR
jgi:tetratricopeptide (TPR) repeat protein